MSITVKGYHVRTSALPPEVKMEAYSHIEAILEKGKNPEELGGKRLRDRRDIASIPLISQYRLVLKRRADKSWAPIAIHSHEKYNKEDYTKKSIRLVMQSKKKKNGRPTPSPNKPKSQRENEWLLNGKPLWINDKSVPASTWADKYDIPYSAIYQAIQGDRVLGEKKGGRWFLMKSKELIDWLKSYHPRKEDPPKLLPPEENYDRPARESDLLQRAKELYARAMKLQTQADNLKYEAERLRRKFEHKDREGYYGEHE